MNEYESISKKVNHNCAYKQRCSIKGIFLMRKTPQHYYSTIIIDPSFLSDVATETVIMLTDLGESSVCIVGEGDLLGSKLVVEMKVFF